MKVDIEAEDIKALSQRHLRRMGVMILKAEDNLSLDVEEFESALAMYQHWRDRYREASTIQYDNTKLV